MERFKQKQNIEPESEQTLETKGVAILPGYPPHLICTQFQKSHHFLRHKKKPSWTNHNIGTKIHYFPIVQKELYFSFPRDPITVFEGGLGCTITSETQGIEVPWNHCQKVSQDL